MAHIVFIQKLIDNKASHDSYMPYLALILKTSQNSAHLEINAHLIEFSDHLTINEEHKSHYVVFITSLLYLNKGFWLFSGGCQLQSDFCKISQNFNQISLKNLPYHRFQSTAYCMYDDRFDSFV